MAYESVRERPHAPFVEMGRREAAEHARWFASTVGERVGSLRSYALAHGCRGPLDLSRESLLPLWSWFLGRSEVARPPGGGPERLSGESAALARDIDVYLCEAVRSAAWGRLSWGCVPGPRSLVGVNMPALLGFAGGGCMPAGRDGTSPNRVLERNPGTLQDAFGWEMTSVPGPGPWRPWGHWGVPLGRDLADTCALEGRLDDLLHRMGDPEVGEEALWTSSEDSRSWRAHREAEARGLRQEACLGLGYNGWLYREGEGADRDLAAWALACLRAAGADGMGVLCHALVGGGGRATLLRGLWATCKGGGWDGWERGAEAAVHANLCTLLRPHGCWRRRNAAKSHDPRPVG